LSNRIELGDFLYDPDEPILKLPQGLGDTRIAFGFCSGTNWRYCFPSSAETQRTDTGARVKTTEFFIPPRLGHGGVVCYHRPAYAAGLTVANVQGTAELTRSEHGFDVVLSGRAQDRIKNAFVHMDHFPAHAEILVPWLGGRAINDIPPGTLHVFEYPDSFNWVHQFVIFQCDDAGMMIRFDDPTYGIKRLVLSTLEEEHGLQVCVYAMPTDAGAPHEWTSPPFKFESFQGGWQVAAKRYRDWLEVDRGLKPFHSADVVTQRQRDLCLLVNLRGQNWGPFIYNTFDQMCDSLKELAQYIEQRYCAAYIEGYDGGYLPACTDFMPGDDLGGAHGFTRLIDCAHQLGYLVTPYIHTHSLSAAHPQFERFKQSTFDQWFTDFDGDGVVERMFWNVRADDDDWNEMQLGRLKRFFESFDVDGVLLDETCIPVPTPNPHSYIRGCRDFVDRLKGIMRPGSFVMTEGLAEPYLDAVRMGQTPVHSRAYTGANVRARDMLRPLEHMRLHPVVKFVSNYFARFTAHSSMRAAEEEEAHEYQARSYSRLGVIPMLNLHRAAERIADSPLLLADIARARRIAEGIESLEHHQ